MISKHQQHLKEKRKNLMSLRRAQRRFHIKKYEQAIKIKDDEMNIADIEDSLHKPFSEKEFEAELKIPFYHDH